MTTTALAPAPAAEAGANLLTAAEKETAAGYIAQSLNLLTGALQGLSPTQWNFIPAAGAWSISLIAEHAIFVLERVLGPMQDQLLSAPETPPAQDTATIDSIVLLQFPNRLRKFSAPEFAQPSGRFPSPADALSVLPALRARAEELLDRPGLRLHALEAPPLKAVTGGAHTMLDAYQWILAAFAHAERHTKQILEVRAAPAFPAA